MEKAHPQVFDLFLQIFDEGRLTGAHGEPADFTHSVVILTSNLDPRPQAPSTAVGFVAEPPPDLGGVDPRELLAGYLRPELLNRIDEVVVFNTLGPDELGRIVDRYLREIETLAADRELKLELDEDVYRYLINLSVGERFGARELRRVVDRELRQPLAETILRREGPLGTLRCSLGDDGIEFGD